MLIINDHGIVVRGLDASSLLLSAYGYLLALDRRRNMSDMTITKQKNDEPHMCSPISAHERKDWSNQADKEADSTLLITSEVQEGTPDFFICMVRAHYH